MIKKFFENKIKILVESNGNFDLVLSKISNSLEQCATNQTKKVPRYRFAFVCAFVCGFFGIVCFSAFLSYKMLNLKPNETSSNKTDNSSANAASLPDFETLKTYEKFKMFTFCEKQYASYDGVLGYIDSDLIGEKIGEIDLETNDALETIVENEHAIIYKIKNISQDYKIAVKFSKESGCFLYYSSYVEDQISLDEFMTCSGLYTFAFLDEVTYSYSIEGEGIARTKTINHAKEDIENLIKRNKDVTNVYSSDYFSPYNHFVSSLSIKIVTNKLGGTISYLKISDDGRACFTSSGNNTFLFDVNDVDALKNIIMNSL